MQMNYAEHAKGSYTLKNVRLETGFIASEDVITGTETKLFCIEIEGATRSRL